MKKILLAAVIMLVTGVALVGCGKSNTPMDQQAGDGKYYYKNQSLNFSVTLPSEFEYYQTQRKEGGGYVDIEFFIPTTDADYSSDVPDYAKPLVVRVFDKSAWDQEIDTGFYEQVAIRNDKVYTIKFWNIIPKDWQDSWGQEMKNNIKESFKTQ